MQPELVFYSKERKTKHYLSLRKSVYRIGKALDNDVVLLDANAPLYLVTIEKINGRYTWNHQEQQADAEKNRFLSESYEFFISKNAFWVKSTIAVLVFALSVAFFANFHTQALVPVTKLKLPARGVYGNSDLKQPLDSLVFEFQPRMDRFSVLHYTPGNVIHAEDLQIKVNGQFLSFAPASPNKWNIEQTIYIARGKLKEGSNELEFVVSENKQNRWAIKDIYIEELVEEPVVQSGMELLRNAEKLFHERHVRKGNLVRAQLIAKQAGLFYYARREAYPEALRALMEKIMREKQDMINEHQMMIQKYKQQGDGMRAKRVYRNLMSELFDTMDPDRNKIIREHERAQ